MKNFVKISLVLVILFLTACAEEKLYTVEELKENPALIVEILENSMKIKFPKEIDLENYKNAGQAEFELVFGGIRETLEGN